VEIPFDFKGLAQPWNTGWYGGTLYHGQFIQAGQFIQEICTLTTKIDAFRQKLTLLDKNSCFPTKINALDKMYALIFFTQTRPIFSCVWPMASFLNF